MSYQVLNKLIYSKQVERFANTKDKKILKATITGYSKVAKASIYFIEYKYKCDEENYSDEVQIPELINNDMLDSLKDKTVPVFVSNNDCSFNIPLIRKQDFIKLNLPVPDSLNWLYKMYK